MAEKSIGQRLAEEADLAEHKQYIEEARAMIDPFLGDRLTFTTLNAIQRALDTHQREFGAIYGRPFRRIMFACQPDDHSFRMKLEPPDYPIPLPLPQRRSS